MVVRTRQEFGGNPDRIDGLYSLRHHHLLVCWTGFQGWGFNRELFCLYSSCVHHLVSIRTGLQCVLRSGERQTNVAGVYGSDDCHLGSIFRLYRSARFDSKVRSVSCKLLHFIFFAAVPLILSCKPRQVTGSGFIGSTSSLGSYGLWS